MAKDPPEPSAEATGPSVDSARARGSLERAFGAMSATRRAAEGEEAEDWIVSYMDMVTLLMTVFLGMVAILTIERKFERIDRGLAHPSREASKPNFVPMITTDLLADSDPPPPTNAAQPDTVGAAAMQPATPPGPQLSDEARKLFDDLAKAKLPPGVTLDLRDRRVVVEIADKVLFASGQADLTADGRRIVQLITPALGRIDGVVSVEGHTDDVPISNARFASNWELSAARASVVARLLEESGIARMRLRAIGYADTRPIALPPAGRALNRRVVLVVEP